MRCPSCDQPLCRFTALWLTAPLKKWTCTHCGTLYRPRKTGIIKFSSYLIGLAVAALLILVREKLVSPPWLLAIIPILGADYLLDIKLKHLIHFEEQPSNKPTGGDVQ